jgi:hypothetical protein
MHVHEYNAAVVHDVIDLYNGQGTLALHFETDVNLGDQSQTYTPGKGMDEKFFMGFNEPGLIHFHYGDTVWTFDDDDNSKMPHCSVGGWDDGGFFTPHTPDRQADCYFLC